MSCSCQSAATLPAAAPGPADGPDAGACSGAESFALRVLGDDMAPEFNEGEIIIIEPDGALKDGSYVVLPLPDLAAVRGVIIQKAVPGRRRLSKFYV